jgi:hypothetical protein
MYVDDLVIFVVPSEVDITVVRVVLDIFVAVSGLHTNMAKCQFTPISCLEDHINLMNMLFPCQLVHFLANTLEFHYPCGN